MNNNYKICFVDVETTGTNFDKHHIYQLAAIVTNADLTEELDSVKFTFKPVSLEEWEESAFQTNGWSTVELSVLKTNAESVYRDFTKFLGKHVDKYDKKDKMFFSGYNSRFDADFVRKFFTLHNDNYFGSWFWNPPIDVMNSLAHYAMPIRSSFPDFKLQTVCKAAGIKWDDSQAHDALYDIRQTIKLAQFLKDKMPR